VKKITKFLTSRRWITTLWATSIGLLIINTLNILLTGSETALVAGACCGASIVLTSYQLDGLEDKDEM